MNDIGAATKPGSAADRAIALLRHGLRIGMEWKQRDSTSQASPLDFTVTAQPGNGQVTLSAVIPADPGLRRGDDASRAARSVA